MGETAKRTVGPLIAVVAGVVGCVLLAVWSGKLPDPVASHFGMDGGADGFSSLTNVILIAAITAVVGALIAAYGAFIAKDTTTSRILVGIGTGTAVFIIATEVWITARQRGLADAAEATAPNWVMVVCGLISLLIGIGAGLSTPARANDYGRTKALGEVPVAHDGRREWQGTASAGVTGLVAMGASVAVLIGLGVVMTSWFLLGLAVLVAIVSLGLMGSIKVTVSSDGFHAHNSLGWPKIDMALADIRRAEVVNVNGFRDFGGWGYRVAGRGELRGVKGFVLRSGEALLVVGDDRRELVVVDGAVEAAGILNALVSH
ncbi:MAG: DUF1648 domain-containing protein [Gordonia sp. (in: high G+C Gram-positive bacteria)]